MKKRHLIRGVNLSAILILAVLALTFDASGRVVSSKRPKIKSCTARNLRTTIKKLEPIHKKLGKPQSGDWLDQHKEPGQSFKQYMHCRPIRPNKKRQTIAILPIGKFSGRQDKILALTAEFLGIYYDLPVRTLPEISDRKIPAKATRVHPSWGMKQFLSTYILNKILKPRLPKDAMVLFGITATDLWPGKGWNFVYGQAALYNRVGVQSIYRNGNVDGDKDEFRLYLRRTIKTATHEMGHVISIRHCTAWECNMCGANHREESDRNPLWMCPQCLAKLCWAVQVDPVERYRKLEAFCRKHGLVREADFYAKSIKRLAPAASKTRKK